MEETIAEPAKAEYEIDYTKVESIEDLKTIFKIFRFRFTKEGVEKNNIIHLVKLIEDESRDK